MQLVLDDWQIQIVAASILSQFYSSYECLHYYQRKHFSLI
jgi:hypothetical protein